MSEAAVWDFSCRDWEDRLTSGRSIMPELPLDKAAAARAVAIFNELRLPDVAGYPKLTDAGADWFREIVGATYGSVDATGLRRVRELLLLVPKKNSKTTNAGALALTGMMVETEPNQAYSIYGPTQEIADRAFSQAKGMIEVDPDLTLRFHIVEHRKMIHDRKWGTTLKVSTFDEKVATGTIPKWVLVEEIHVLGKIAYAQRVLGQLRGGMLARPGALLVMITTQSDEAPSGVFKAELAFARAIRDGRITGPAATLLPLLYEFSERVQRDPGELWEDPAIWPQVLPNLGKSLRLDMLKADYAGARSKGEGERRRWLSQHLNIEIGLALHSDQWAGARYWQAAGDEALTLDALLDRSEVVVAGIDGGGLDDLLGLALIGRDRETKQWLHWGHAWAHDDVWAQRPQIAALLEDYIADGDLTRCAAPTEDLAGVADILQRVNERGLFPEKDAIGVDRAGIGMLVDELIDRGLTDDQMIAVPQGWMMNGHILATERKLKDGTLVHAAQGILAWSVSQSRIKSSGNAVMITKETSGKSKIDPVIALLNAVALMSRNPESMMVGSVYDQRGVIVL